MKTIYFSLLFSLIFAFGCSDKTEKSAELSDIKSDVHQADTTRAERQTGFIEQAEKLLIRAPLTVTDKPGNTKFSDSRNYISLACYWWPNPDSETGLPYVRSDGDVNPETRSEASDLPIMIEMSQRVEVLTKAYHKSGNSQFAHKAIEQLKAWYVDEETAMYPHLEHAQMVKGRNMGRSYGVIDTWWLIRVVESIPTLRESEDWTDELEIGLKKWFTNYLNWLRNSEFGISERNTSNNHGTWYDLQVVTFARFVDQDPFAKRYLADISIDRISKQIAMSGRQKYEVRRPRPLHYSIYNLYGLLRLARHGESLGVDLRNQDRLFSGNLEDALLYLIDRMDGVDPATLIDRYDATETDILYQNLLQHGRDLYEDPKIMDELTRLQKL